MKPSHPQSPRSDHACRIAHPDPNPVSVTASMRFVLLTLVLTVGSSVLAEESADDVAQPSANTSAVAILKTHCKKCHGEAKRAGELDVRSLDSLQAGGRRGPALVPGKAAESRLIELIQPGAKPHMPPGGKQLTSAQIATLTSWIDGLAPVETPRTKKELSEVGEGALPPRGARPTDVINLLIGAGYANREVIPNTRCDDVTFVRRVYLDLNGRIPTAEERVTFLQDTDSAKRTRLIRGLLSSEEFAEHFAEAFDTMLMGRVERQLPARAKHGWHEFLKESFAENRPWTEVARDVLLARAESEDRGHLWYLYERKDDHQAIAEAISRGFFGVDIACAQCHDHPLAGEIKQAHYWGLVSFFKRSKNAKSDRGIAVAESAVGGFDDFSNALSGDTESAVLTFLHADVVAEDRPDDPQKVEDQDALYRGMEKEPRVPLFSRRERFVDEVLAGHPLLARAMVNRLWGLLLGRGLIDPVDEMDSMHPPSHPTLLAWLSRDFSEHGYDVKRFVTAVVCSDVYQLAAKAPTNPDLTAFAHALERPLTAETYLRSLAQSLELPVDDLERRLGSEFRLLFPEVVGGEQLTSLRQTMSLSNFPPLQEMMRQAGIDWAEREPEVGRFIDRAYERFYGREATPTERDTIHQYVRQRADRTADAYAHVLWALATSAEFRFNH